MASRSRRSRCRFQVDWSVLDWADASDTGIVLRTVEQGYDVGGGRTGQDLDGPLMIQAFHDRLVREPSRGCQHPLRGLAQLGVPT